MKDLTENLTQKQQCVAFGRPHARSSSGVSGWHEGWLTLKASSVSKVSLSPFIVGNGLMSTLNLRDADVRG